MSDNNNKKKGLYPNAIFYPSYYRSKEGKNVPRTIVSCNVAVGKDTKGFLAHDGKKAAISFNAALNCDVAEAIKAVKEGHDGYGKAADNPTWVNVKAFGIAAESILRLHKAEGFEGVKKGDMMQVEGTITLEEWTSKDGKKGSTWTIVLSKSPTPIGRGVNAGTAKAEEPETAEAEVPSDEVILDDGNDEMPEGFESISEDEIAGLIEDDEEIPF